MLVTRTEPLPIERGARLSVGSVGRTTPPPASCARAAAGRVALIGPPRRTALHATAQSGHDVNITGKDAAELSASACSIASGADAAPLRRRRRTHSGSCEHHRRRHEVRVRLMPRPRKATGVGRIASSYRRSADARLLAFLAKDTNPGGAQKLRRVRARLPRADPLEQDAAGPRCRRSRAQHAREIRHL